MRIYACYGEVGVVDYSVFWRESVGNFVVGVFLDIMGFVVWVFMVFMGYMRGFWANFFGGFSGFGWCVFGGAFWGVLKIFFCEVSETTITQMCKYEQIFNVKLPPCKYRKYFNFLIWAIQKLTVSHFLIPTILIWFIGVFNCKLL